MTTTIRIDLVSDIACPWCAVGLSTLDRALEKIDSAIKVNVHLQPFELNPNMPLGGQDVIEHLTEKYNMSAEQVLKNQQNIYTRGAEVGFNFHPEGRKRVYNTFNCHRLMFWAEEKFDAQAALNLKKELLAAYFTLAIDMDDRQTLLDAVTRAGLDANEAALVVDDASAYAQQVREAQQAWQAKGIHAVPAFVIEQKYLIEGAQPAESLINAIEHLAKQKAGA
jgi:predicted DsbA family dithiol-disulfide isomerase